MSGGFSRQSVTRCIPVVLLLATLTGCSALFGPKPAPETEQPAPPPPPEPASEAEAPASAPVAASAPAVEPKHETAEAKRPPPRKPIARAPARPREPATPTPAPTQPVAPPPIITTRLLSPEQSHGLLDTRVQRPDGKIIGRAIDMDTDASGKPLSMLVNLSGFMGIGDRKMRFPWSAFRFGPAPRKAPITLDIGPNEPPGAEASRAHAKEAQQAGGKRGAARVPLTLPIIDATVERQNGERVGRVIDVLIDGNAQPQAAVLDVGSLISHDRRSIAADWSALRFVTKDDELELQMDLSDAQIDAAPPYSSDEPVRAVSPAPAHAAAPAGAARGGSSSGLASAARTQR
jgi:hypothetical protein